MATSTGTGTGMPQHIRKAFLQRAEQRKLGLSGQTGA